MRSVTSPVLRLRKKGTGEARWLAMAASASNAVRKIDIEALIG